MLTTRQLISKFREAGSTITTASVSTWAALDANQLISAGSEHALQTAIPVWAIIDSTLGLVDEGASLLGNALEFNRGRKLINSKGNGKSKTKSQEVLLQRHRAMNIAKSLLKIYGNAQLLDKAIDAISNPMLTNTVFNGFAIKYGIEFGIALGEWLQAEHMARELAKSPGFSAQAMSDARAILNTARLKVVDRGLLFAGFLALALGHPIGFIILAAYTLGKLAITGGMYLREKYQNSHSTKSEKPSFWQRAKLKLSRGSEPKQKKVMAMG